MFPVEVQVPVQALFTLPLPPSGGKMSEYSVGGADAGEGLILWGLVDGHLMFIPVLPARQSS
jgi:hypothetical protein